MAVCRSAELDYAIDDTLHRIWCYGQPDYQHHPRERYWNYSGNYLKRIIRGFFKALITIIPLEISKHLVLRESFQ